MAHDAVISYSSRDKLQADAICNRLESRGIRCWIAPRDVGLGEYAESIVNAIEEAKVMVLVFSANADQSPQVRREVERAVSKGTTIVPVRIEDAEMSKALELYVSSMHWLDAITPPLEQHLDKLADDLSALLAGKRETASPPPQEPAEREPAPVPTASPPPQRPADKEPAPVVSAAPQPTSAPASAGLRNKIFIGVAALAVILLGVLVLIPGSEDEGPAMSPGPDSAEVAQPEVTIPPEQEPEPTEVEQPEVTGWSVVVAEFGTGGGEYLGAYRQAGRGTWQEEGPDGAVRFELRSRIGTTGRSICTTARGMSRSRSISGTERSCTATAAIP